MEFDLADLFVCGVVTAPDRPALVDEIVRAPACKPDYRRPRRRAESDS